MPAAATEPQSMAKQLIRVVAAFLVALAVGFTVTLIIGKLAG